MKLDETRTSTDDLLNLVESQSKVLLELENLVESGKAEIEPVYYSQHSNCALNNNRGNSSLSQLATLNNSCSNNANNGNSTNGYGDSVNGNNSQHKKLKRRKAYKNVATHEVFCFVSSDNVTYKHGGKFFIFLS